MDKKLKKEEVEPIAEALRKIITHDGLEKLIASHGAYRERCELQEKWIKTHEEIEQITKKLVEGLKEQVESEKAYVKSVEEKFEKQNELSNGMLSLIENQSKEILALSQTEIHSRAIAQTSDYYAVEARSILVYVLERNDRSLDWIRLWEALPQDQKNLYNQDSKAWLLKQPPHVDPELRKKMLPAPAPKPSDPGQP